MTSLNKIVRRDVGKLNASDPRGIIIALFPAEHGVPASIGLKEKGRRNWFMLPVGKAYLFAVRLAVDAKRAEKLAARKSRRLEVTRGRI